MRPRPLPRMSCRRRSATRSASQCEALLRPPQAICSSAVTKQGTSCGASTRSHQSPNSSPEISSASTVRPAVWAPGAFVIMVGDAAHEPEADAAIRKEFEYLRRTGDKRGQPSFVDSAAAEKSQVGEYLIAAVGDPGLARQIVLANPDEAVGMNRATTERRRLFEHDRLQAKLVNS